MKTGPPAGVFMRRQSLFVVEAKIWIRFKNSLTAAQPETLCNVSFGSGGALSRKSK